MTTQSSRGRRAGEQPDAEKKRLSRYSAGSLVEVLGNSWKVLWRQEYLSRNSKSRGFGTLERAGMELGNESCQTEEGPHLHVPSLPDR